MAIELRSQGASDLEMGPEVPSFIQRQRSENRRGAPVSGFVLGGFILVAGEGCAPSRLPPALSCHFSFSFSSGLGQVPCNLF